MTTLTTDTTASRPITSGRTTRPPHEHYVARQTDRHYDQRHYDPHGVRDSHWYEDRNHVRREYHEFSRGYDRHHHH